MVGEERRNIVIAIGMGGNSRAHPNDFALALEEFCRESGGCDVVATFEKAIFADGVKQAAKKRGATFRSLPLDALIARSSDCLTQSKRTLELFGIASVAEAAALAAAGHGSHLRIARRIFGNVSIAAAESQGAGTGGQ
jgi:cobalt-precorrin 5A hydrolase